MATARIYIMRHERYEAAEAYADYLTAEQIETLKDIENEFWLEIDYSTKESKLFEIQDEG